MEESIVSFKAKGNELILVMREEDDFDKILESLGRKLDSSGRFFKGASLDVRYRGKKLNGEQERIISKMIEEKASAEVASFKEDEDHQEQESSGDHEEPDRTRDKLRMRLLYFRGLEEGMTKFYRGTVRSGTLVSYEGNVVILGDVNPGGEVVAAGNVVVMGSLRGLVHAGADGNKEAIVAALSLQPTQLRIADVITRPPDSGQPKQGFLPEIAFVKDDMVYIETFLPQHK
ncbi:MAG TPA: septum site-determining protein MinC [Clostridiales bacterium]|nr:septum site-determining protein MinC [Clostridiales bacterium]HPV01470.1 septum site-determining protein MinC [Clostridiales bacterium]